MDGVDDVPWDPLSVAGTRPAVIKALLIPFWFIVPIVGIPMILTTATVLAGAVNPWWLVLIIPLTAIGRWIVAKDHNRPRVLFLSLISGVMFGDRHRWGGITADPLGEFRHER